MHVYVTEQCRDDAREHALTDQVERLCSRIKQDQRASVFDNFPPPFIKKRYGNLRLIAEQRNRGEDAVVCFLRILPRSSGEYKAFLDKKQDTYREQLRLLVTDDDLEAVLQQAQSSESLPPTKSLSPEEETFLWNTISEVGEMAGEVMVCESPEWVAQSTDPRVANRYSLFYEGVGNIAQQNSPQNQEYLLPSGEGILYRFFPELKILFLVAPMLPGISVDRNVLTSPHEDILTKQEGHVTRDEVLKHTARAYPDLVLADLDIWSQIQKNAEANIALSPEEITVLRSVDISSHTESDSNVSGFPLFINGRAGSGKSTVLQYLFSEYLHYYLTHLDTCPFAPPVYFTYNLELLERSKKVAEDLIRANYSKLVNAPTGVDLLNQHRGLVDQAFLEFHSFLYNLLPAPERQERFIRANYVNYARFKTLWEQKFGKMPVAQRPFGPDLCWHVIRTYIKGFAMEPGEYLDLEEYELLPQKQQSVTSETFRQIFERVWQAWYQPLNSEGYWDDQDLAHALLELGKIQPLYPAVFCDEAQDFTQLELEILFRLCLYSDRQLQAHHINRVPFTFAGDPFQTLNPTGFRWDAIKAAFVERFVYALAPHRRGGQTDINYRELIMNYRSSRYIVELCNTIQALRASLFDIQSLNPQEPYRFESNPPNPVWFRWDDPDALEQLRSNEDITIIVPCEEGEEVTYVEANPALAQLVRRDEDGTPQAVLSASRAKGLEFNRVVLFGFGEAAPEGLIKTLQGESVELSAEQALPLEYFVNRLYVAASRPKRRLFVFDSKERGLENFWAFARREDLTEKLLGRLKNSAAWRRTVGMLHKGNLYSWSEDREDPLVLAEQYEAEGTAKHDPYLLRQAAMMFERVGNVQRAHRCRAESKIIEEKYGEAGVLFLENGDAERAVTAFWRGTDYVGVLRVAEQYSDVVDMPEHRFASFIMGQPSAEEGISLLRDFLSRCESPLFRGQVIDDMAWQEALKALLRKLVALNTSNVRTNTWQVISELLTQIRGKEIRLDQRLLGHIEFFAENMTNAVAFWDREKERPQKEYRIAKAKTMPYPQNIALLNEAGLFLEIIQQYEKNERVELNREDLIVVANAYFRAGMQEQALQLYTEARDLAQLQSLLFELQPANTELAKQVAFTILVLMVEQGDWQEAWSFAQKGELAAPRGTARDKATGTNRFLRSLRHDLTWIFLKAAARSDALAEETTDRKAAVMSFLKRYSSGTDASWRQYLTFEELSAAVERSGKDVDALNFYEKVQGSPKFTLDEQDFAATRWVRCKERQAERDTRRGRTTDASRKLKDAQRKRLEIKLESTKRLGEYPRLRRLVLPWSSSKEDSMPVPAITDQPEQSTQPQVHADMHLTEPHAPAPETKSGSETAVEAIKVTTQSSDALGTPRSQAVSGTPQPTAASSDSSPYTRSEWSLHGQRFEFFHQRGRLNVTDSDGNQLSIRGLEKSISGDVVKDQIDDQGNVFLCHEWDLECNFSEMDIGNRFSVSLLKCGITLTFDIDRQGRR